MYTKPQYSSIYFKNYKVNPKGAKVDHDRRHESQPVQPMLYIRVNGQKSFTRICRFKVKELDSDFECDTEGESGI